MWVIVKYLINFGSGSINYTTGTFAFDASKKKWETKSSDFFKRMPYL